MCNEKPNDLRDKTGGIDMNDFDCSPASNEMCHYRLEIISSILSVEKLAEFQQRIINVTLEHSRTVTVACNRNFEGWCGFILS